MPKRRLSKKTCAEKTSNKKTEWQQANSHDNSMRIAFTNLFITNNSHERRENGMYKLNSKASLDNKYI